MAYAPITNVDLAEQYFRVAKIKHRGDVDIYRTISRRIAGLEGNIADFYHDHGRSLQEFRARGVGENTLHVLELILAEGEEQAAAIMREEKMSTGEQQRSYRDRAASLNQYDAQPNPARERKGQLWNKIKKSQKR